MSEENILQTPVHHNTECHDRDRHKSKLSEMHQVRKGESEVKPQWMIYQKYVDLKEEGAKIIILDSCGYSCRVFVASKRFIALKPLISVKNKMVDVFYHLTEKVLRSLERKGYIDIDYGEVISLKTIVSWRKRAIDKR